MLINKKRPNGTLEVAWHNIDELTGESLPSKTIQSTKDETDVNLIIARAKRGIATTHLNTKKGVYADLTGAPDYQKALQTIIDANASFETLPASTRKRFQNDPQQFLEFVNNPKENYDEGVKLGLFNPKPTSPTPTQNTETQNTKTQNIPLTQNTPPKS